MRVTLNGNLKMSFYLCSSFCMYSRPFIVLTSVVCKPDNYLQPPAVPKLSLSKDVMSEFYSKISDYQDFIIFVKQATIHLYRGTGKFYHRLLSLNYHCQNKGMKHIVWFYFPWLLSVCLHTHSSEKLGNSQWGSLSLVWIRKFLLCFRNQVEVLRRWNAWIYLNDFHYCNSDFY